MPMPSDDTAASAIVAAKLTGRHVLHIEGYSHTKALINGERLLSQPFNVGGRAWCIWYYPHGAINQQGVSYRGYISVYLALAEDIPEPAYAEATFHLLDQAENPVPAYSRTIGLGLYSADLGHEIVHGFPDFIYRELLEASDYQVDECYKIACDVSVWKECATESRPDAPPPPDLHRHLRDLLVSKEGADVEFQVAGRTFSAHRSVVAARSPVLKAMLFGPTAAAAAAPAVGACVRIYGTAPRVFEALLHFVYTDSLPEVTGRWKDDARMDMQLLQAADRFGMQRLRPICEERLCRYINVDSAAGFLLFAQLHGCHRLREACVEFLKCPRALNAVMATDGFEHLVKGCPALLKDIMSKLAAC